MQNETVIRQSWVEVSYQRSAPGCKDEQKSIDRLRYDTGTYVDYSVGGHQQLFVVKDPKTNSSA